MQEQIVGFLNPIIALIYSAGFFLLWLRARHNKFLLGLVIAGVARATGVFVSFSLPVAPSMVIHLVSLVCFSIGCTALVWAVCERAGQRSQLKVHVAIASIGAVLMIFAGTGGSFFPVNLITGTTLGLIVASGAQTLASAAPRDTLDRVITWLTALYAAQFFIRPLSAFVVSPDITFETYGESSYYAVVIVTFAVMTILHSTAVFTAVLVDQFRRREAETEADPLTGLKLRRAFEERSVDLLDRANKAGTPVAMIVGDIDHFKQVNDLWGHQTGDKVISSFGGMVGDLVRDSDLCGRIGGEEFCILVWNCEQASAQKLAERIRRAFAAMTHEGVNDNIRITASFGVAAWQKGEGYGRLFARADAALYEAKNGGRDQVVSAEAKHDGGREKPVMVTSLPAERRKQAS